MTLWDLESVGRAGVVLRRAVWSTAPADARSLRFAAGAGTDPAVGVLRVGTTERPLRAGDLTAEDWRADDWRIS
jgi:hypothetical protein